MKLDIEGVFGGEGLAADAMRRAADCTVADVGGGASTAAALTRGMVDEGLRRLKAGAATPEELERGMQKAIDAVLHSLAAQSRTIDDPERLAQIAAARENVEPRLADMLATALKTVPAGSVRIFESPHEETNLRFSTIPDSATIVVGGMDAARRASGVQRALQVAHAIDREGAVVGGGVAYLRASRALDELVLDGGEVAGVDLVRMALRVPAWSIAKTSGVEDPMAVVRRIWRAKGDKGLNVATGRFENLTSAGVLDPTVVARAAVKNAGEAASSVFLGTGNLTGAQGPPPQVPATAAGDTPPPPSAGATVVRYTQVTCPRKVSLRAEPFTVLVGLTLAPTSPASMPATVDPSVAVAVRLASSAGLEVLGEPSAELAVLPDRDSTPASFKVRASARGWHTLRVMYSQSGHPVAEVALTVEAVDQDVNEESVSVSVPMVAPGDATPPDFRLFITYSDSTLTFELQRGTDPPTSFPPVALESSLEDFMRAQYVRLDQLRRGLDTVALDVRGRVRRLDSKDVDARIGKLGRVLWNDLVPPALRSLYAEERNDWRDKGFMILSNEPFVPWELVVPFDDQGGTWADPGPWCESLALTRWLRPEPDSNSVASAAPVELPLARMSILAPTPPADQPLPAAGQEKAFLDGFRATHRIARAGVDPATQANVMGVLRDGGYDWLHAVTHGTVDANPTGYAVLWLEGDESIEPDDFVDELVVKALVEHRPAFVLNACELGRGSWSLRGTSGWAKRLVGKGAGLLIAPLWAVTDERAVTFVTALYEQLATGAPLGRAVRDARKATCKAGDPTWLAYSVYGHPNATLRIEATHG